MTPTDSMHLSRQAIVGGDEGINPVQARRRRMISLAVTVTIVAATPLTIVLMLGGFLDKNQALLTMVWVALLGGWCGFVWYQMWRKPIWLILQFAAVLATVAELLSSVDAVYVSFHIVARIIVTAVLFRFLWLGSRRTHRGAGGQLSTLEASIVVVAVAAWFLAVQPRFWPFGKSSFVYEFQYFWGPLLHVMTVVATVLLLARTKFSFGPTMLLCGYLLTSGATIASFVLGAAQTVPAAALPYFVPILIGSALVGLGLMHPTIVQLPAGTVPLRAPRSWQRTAWILAVPAIVVGGVAIRAESVGGVLWPMLLLVSIGSLVMRNWLVAERTMDGSAKKSVKADSVVTVSLTALEAWAGRFQSGADRRDLAVIVVSPVTDLTGRIRSTESGLHAELRQVVEEETLRRLTDVLVSGEGTRVQDGSDWKIARDRQRLIVVLTQRVPWSSTPDGVARVASSMASLLAVPFRSDGLTLRVEFTVGIAWGSEPGHQVSHLVQDATWAGRTGGPGEVRRFNPAQRRETRRRAQLAAALDEALPTGAGLGLKFVPVLDLHARVTVAAAVSALWAPPEFGRVESAELVAIAEQTRSIFELHDWMLGLACSGFVLGRRAGIVHRFSAVEIARPDLEERIRHILDRTSTDPEALTLQIADSSLVGNASLADLRGLASAGVRLSLAGFGSETTGLSRLLNLPWHSISLAQVLTEGISAQADRQSALVRAIVEMSQEIGVKVAAVGLLDLEAVAVVAGLGCDYASGPAFGVPRATFAEAIAYHLPG